MDHAAGAKKAGMDMKPTQLLIFGNPKLGTPLMLATRTIGIDPPLKARYGVSGRDQVFKKMTRALNKLTNVAIKAGKMSCVC